MKAVPLVQPIPSGIVSLDDHQRHAQKILDENAWAYFSGGAADEFTLTANSTAWSKLPLWPRVLRHLAGGNTQATVLGRSVAHPVFLAPVAFQKMAHVDGELASAYAAAMQQAGMVLSTQASVLLEDVAEAIRAEPLRGPLWFQLYVQHDRPFTRHLVDRAEQAGYEALVVTVDATASGARDRERRVGFRLPDGVSAVNLNGLPHHGPFDLAPHQSRMFDALLTSSVTWEDIAWLRGITSLPIVVKGILHPADARLAVDAGVNGIVVSNHGGRTLDTVPPTATALPWIRRAAGKDVTIMVDGGIRRGTDILKAIALGADAVLIGRPYIFALANAGALGVAHIIRLLRDELEIAMALSGCRTLADAAEILETPFDALA